MKAVFLLFFSILLCSCTTTLPNLQRRDKGADSNDTVVMNRVVKDLCGVDVAVLGEPGHHGDGRAVEFKVKLVQRLVDECHFDTVLFESPIYDFLNFNDRIRNKQTVDISMIADAVGGMWSMDAEFQPLLPFLFERATQKKLLLGGVDDQLSSTGRYASDEMANTLASYLSGNTKIRCTAALQTHLQWLYTEPHKYGPADTAALLSCLNLVQSELMSKSVSSRTAKETMHAYMTASLIRRISRDPLSDDMSAGFAARDQSMYLNYVAIISQLHNNAKIIVWTATVHARKIATISSIFQTIPFGVYIRRNMQKHVFTIGFSALSGSYGRRQIKPLPVAPPESLESMAFKDNGVDEKYFSFDDLKKAGLIPARGFDEDFNILHWDTVIDGLVVFRETRPPKLVEALK
jgi:erythromycin esterase-like protein